MNWNVCCTYHGCFLKGRLIGSAVKLGSGLGGILVRRKLNGSTTLPIATTGVVGTRHMVFTNPIMTTHVNRIVDVMNPKWGYRKPPIVTVPIFNHRLDHYVRPNEVALKYLDFKNGDPYDHVKMFIVVKANAKISEEYIMNVFKYMLKDTTSDWCHNYIS